MTPAIPLVFCVVLTLAFVTLMVWWAFRAARRASLEPTWPSVTGFVSRSDLVSGKIVRPKIVYRYSFGGREYAGKVIQSNMVLDSGSNSPQLLIKKFPAGSRPIVYVDSSEPARAVLIPGGDRTFLYFVMALAALFLLAGGFTLVTVVGPLT